MWLEGDIDHNIFKLYPELKIIPEFKALKKEFGEDLASRYIWCIAKTEDPDSKLYNSKQDRRRKLVEDNYIKDSVPWEEEIFKEAIWAYIRECMPPEKKFLKTWGDKLHEADVWLRERDVAAILGGSKKEIDNWTHLVEEYEKNKEKYLEFKQQAKRTKGGYVPSRRQRKKQAME